MQGRTRGFQCKVVSDTNIVSSPGPRSKTEEAVGTCGSLAQ